MKAIVATLATFLFAMTLSIGMFAETISKNVNVPNTVELNGKTLPAGQYKVKVDTTGSTAQVRFMKGNKEIASSPAQVKTLPSKVYATQVEINNAGSTPRLDEIDFGGTTTGVSFATTTASE